MKTIKDYTTKFKDFGIVTVPKGTKVTNNTAMGHDINYHFVNSFDWVDQNYKSVANILKMDLQSYGLNVPKEYVKLPFENFVKLLTFNEFVNITGETDEQVYKDLKRLVKLLGFDSGFKHVMSDINQRLLKSNYKKLYK